MLFTSCLYLITTTDCILPSTFTLPLPPSPHPILNCFPPCFNPHPFAPPHWPPPLLLYKFLSFIPLSVVFILLHTITVCKVVNATGELHILWHYCHTSHALCALHTGLCDARHQLRTPQKPLVEWEWQCSAFSRHSYFSFPWQFCVQVTEMGSSWWAVQSIFGTYKFHDHFRATSVRLLNYHSSLSSFSWICGALPQVYLWAVCFVRAMDDVLSSLVMILLIAMAQRMLSRWFLGGSSWAMMLFLSRGT